MKHTGTRTAQLPRYDEIPELQEILRRPGRMGRLWGQSSRSAAQSPATSITRERTHLGASPSAKPRELKYRWP